MQIRRAETADTPKMAAIHAQGFEQAWAGWQIARLLNTSLTQGFVAEQAGQMEGFALVRSAAGEAEILTLAVAASAQRRGVARALVQHMAATAAAAGAQTLFLEVAVDNPAAIALYEGLGFRRAGVRKGYYARKHAERADAVVMRLDLQGPGSYVSRRSE